MTVAQAILDAYPDLSEAQGEVVGHVEGPLLVIAGPGSGKTFSLVLRTMNLLLREEAAPKEIILCTFTEKAAFELRDRVSAAARKLSWPGDLSELRISTIHGLCNQILSAYRHLTPLGTGFETLDELTQLLFLFDHFEEIVGPEEGGRYLDRWSTRWTAIQGLVLYFNKITEELVDPRTLAAHPDPFLCRLGRAYLAYEDVLLRSNRIDFAHLQREVFDLLQDPQVGPAITGHVKYVMVDEYQDTNFIQEQLLLRLAAETRNLCVVGDEDQSLYRFRGATVRNILEFPQRMPGCRVLGLTTNYRSHQRIVAAYDRWMASADWSNPNGPDFRFDKTIRPDSKVVHPDYPAVFCIWGTSQADEAERLAELVLFLKSNSVIEDYSQIALLLHSVRIEHSGHYLAALRARGVPAFCPRARAYFENEEVRLMVASLAVLFGWTGDGRGPATSGAVRDLAGYVDECLIDLAKEGARAPALLDVIRARVAEIDALTGDQSLDLRPADYFYELLAHPPFAEMVRDENRARNLATLSQLLNTFQAYYHYPVVTAANRVSLRFHLFASFLRLLHDGGINEYEDPDQPFPRGHVQVMTIHQAKGLEFPVVVVGSLDKQLATAKRVDRDLDPFYHRPRFEPAARITHFDRMRLHYVAFSRPQKVLLLSTSGQPKDHFAPIWQGLPQWPYVQKDLLAAQTFRLSERMPVKRSYSFTGDLKVYETCPRQYQFFREYEFAPSRSAVFFFGQLVHQAIEEIHRFVLAGRLAELDEPAIRGIFERTFRFLLLADVRPIGEVARKAAFRQVMDYFEQNRDGMTRVVETEVDVSVEKEGYILTGKVDLLLGKDGRLELLDFKTSPKPEMTAPVLETYERQLCVYAHILERRYGRRPERLLLYWTAERRRADALMEFPYRPERVEAAGLAFDAVVRRIQAGDFKVNEPPGLQTCRNCDLQRLCAAHGLIRAPAATTEPVRSRATRRTS